VFKRLNNHSLAIKRLIFDLYLLSDDPLKVTSDQMPKCHLCDDLLCPTSVQTPQ